MSLILAANLSLMPIQPMVTHTEPETPKDLIKDKARANNLDEDKVIFIARCESQLDHQALGDGNLTCSQTKKPMRSRGLWQINECGHPEITDAQAFDPEWSTNWAMEIFKKGDEAKEWQRCTKKYLTMVK